MLLDRIDIDNHGPLNRVELGPFSEHVNVVCTPEGSGKTAIVRFVRDSLIRRDYPLGMMSSSSGRVVWADRNGKIHCRREHDGSATGRRTVEFESRGDVSHRFDWLHDSWIDGIADSTDATRALESIRIPETIVDGLVTDTAVVSVSRVILAALKSGLCDPALFAGLPLNQSSVSGLSPAGDAHDEAARRAIRDELARIESELAVLESTHMSQPMAGESGVELRRERLHRRLSVLRASQADRGNGYQAAARANPVNAVDHRAASVELAQWHDRVWNLRVRHGELTRWAGHLESDRHRIRYGSPMTASPYAAHRPAALASSNGHADWAGRLDADLRKRLLDIDSELVHWRRVLAEIQGLKESVATRRRHDSMETWSPEAAAVPLSEHWLQRRRMGHFLSSLDSAAFGNHPASADLWYRSPVATSHAAWPEEMDLRIESIIHHIDSLAARYTPRAASHPDLAGGSAGGWYRDVPADVLYRHNESLAGNLAAIRNDLLHVRRHGFRFAVDGVEQAVRHQPEWFDLNRCSNWVATSIERLLRYRESIIQDRRTAELVRYPQWLDETRARDDNGSAWYIDHLNREIQSAIGELDQVTRELDQATRCAAELRRQLRTLPIVDPIEQEISAIRSELASLETASALPSSPRLAWLRSRRTELIEKLGVTQPATASTLPIADEASQWLVRLSAGRLRSVQWNPSDFTTEQAGPAKQANGRLAQRQTFAKIDGRDEATCNSLDRALAALAIRLACGDLLARTGRAIPLVIEAHRELLRPMLTAESATQRQGEVAQYDPADTQVNLAVIAALDDYAKAGRQVVVLASDQIFAEQVARRGGKVFSIHGHRVAHEHRPLWRPHYESETYAGPHAYQHVTPAVPLDATLPLGQSPMNATDAFVDRYYDQYFDNSPVGASLADINRNLDTIWREAYGISPTTHSAPRMPQHSMPQPPMPHESMGYGDAGFGYGAMPAAPPTQTLQSPGAQWHDGYYFTDTYSTSPSIPHQRPSDQDRSHPPGGSGRSSAGTRKPVSPFFLTVDSPIDQAPSVDAVAASRLRRLDVTHINHLMNQDPNRLADALGLSGVTAATIRRWQSECRLVCHVPQLRAFDARVLVGCGITDAAHLSSTDPNDLLDRVEAFLATERGQRILLSGTSYELSRITSWIASANVISEDADIAGVRDHRTLDGRVVRQRDAIGQRPNQDRYDYEFVDDHGQVVRASSRRSTRRSGARSSTSDENRRQRERNSSTARSSKRRSRSGQSATSQRSGSRSTDSSSRRSEQRRSEQRRSEQRGRVRSTANRDRTDRYPSSDSDRQSRSAAHERVTRDSDQDGNEEQRLRFYLERESPIVDAPSIGSRMAAKLEAIGITTVEDLLTSDPAILAEQLDHRRIDADVILAWQNQATMVCRVPMLRGHDAQLLVAAEITTPEDVVQYDAEGLLELIDPIARSNEGKRILRGGKLPDLEEITEWIQYSQLSRELVAA